MSGKGTRKGTRKEKGKGKSRNSSKPRNNKKCINPSWEKVQLSQPREDMEGVFRNILSNVDVAEVYGCLKLLDNMHNSFSEIIDNRATVGSFGGMIDIALINNLNLLKYLKNNNRRTISEIKGSLFGGSNRNGLIGYYTTSHSSAPVLCQIINPDKQMQIREQLNKATTTDEIGMFLQNFVEAKNQSLKQECLEKTGTELEFFVNMVVQYETDFEQWITETRAQIRKLTKRRIETQRKTRLENLRKALSDRGWYKAVALPKLYEITQLDIDKIQSNIEQVHYRNWGRDPEERKEPEDLVDHIFSDEGKQNYPIMAVKLTKDRIESFLSSDIIQVDHPEQFILLPNYLQQVESNTLSEYIYRFDKNGFSFDVPLGYFSILGDAPIINSVDSSTTEGETKSDVTSAVQWRGFWQSIMRHNYKPLGSQDGQKSIESALYFNRNTSTDDNVDWLTNSTPYCTIDDKERLICGICGRPIGEKNWAKNTSGGKGYDVDHVANLIFNELLGLNARSDGLGFLNTCSKCNQAFKSEKIWSPSIELWNVLNQICRDNGYRGDFRWPGWRNTGVIDQIPFGGVRVYTIVNAHGGRNKLIQEIEVKNPDNVNINYAETKNGEGYNSPSARKNVTAEMESYELELLILDRFLQISQTSEGQAMITMENRFVTKYTEKVSIIASGARYIQYQTTLTDLLRNKLIRNKQEHEQMGSQQALDDNMRQGTRTRIGYRLSATDDRKTDSRVESDRSARQLRGLEMRRTNQNDPNSFIEGRTISMINSQGLKLPFNEKINNITSQDRKNFYNKIYKEYQRRTSAAPRRRDGQRDAFLHNSIAQVFYERIDAANLLLLKSELNDRAEVLETQSPPRDTSPGKQDRMLTNQSRAKIIRKHIFPILDAILMLKAMKHSELFPARHILYTGTQTTKSYKMNVLTGETSLYNNKKDAIIDRRLLINDRNLYRRTEAEQKEFKAEKNRKKKRERENQPNIEQSFAAASARSYSPGDVGVIRGQLPESPELTDQDSADDSDVGDDFSTPRKNKNKRGRYGGGKGKTLKIRRRKKNTRRNRKNKNNKTKFKKRYKLKLTRRNK